MAPSLLSSLLYLLTCTCIGGVYGQGHDTSVLTAEEILLKLFDETSGFRWNQRDSWLQTNDVCQYYGITCYDDNEPDQRRRGHVKEIDLSSNHLVGTTPDEIFDLPYIESLSFRDNTDLQVSFTYIGQAQYLKTLIVSNTQVSSLDGIEQATALETLHITNLGITGSIPLNIFQLSNLKGLFANFNKFSGEIPGQIANLVLLEELYLYENELTGQIPAAIGNLSNLKTLSLAQNAFGGSIPTEINQLTKLQILALHRAAGHEAKGPGISGALPSLSQLADISQVYLEHQKLSGNIPNDFLSSASSTEVIKVDLTANAVSGTIPESLASKQRLNLYLADNEISNVSTTFCALIPGWMSGDVGAIGCNALLCPNGFHAPEGRATEAETCQQCSSGADYYGSTSCSGALTGAETERAILVSFYNKMDGRYWKNNNKWLNPAESVCDWYGIDCNTSGQVSGISLRNNDLTDTVPPEIFSLPELRIVDLSSNSIDFQFTNIGSATSLEVLDLTQCDLASLDDIGSLQGTNVRKLSIASNYLEGNLPENIFSLSGLEELDISHNRFDGSLSGSIGQLTNLTRFSCFGNSFSGQFPEEIGNLRKLLEIKAAENDFSGQLPASLNQLKLLQTLSLHQTSSSSSIGGPLLPLTELEELTSLQLDGNALNGTLPATMLENTRRGADRIELLLSNNQLEGEIPASWASRFSNLVVDLSGNQITSIAPNLCNEDAWMDGNVGTFECDGILCRKGTYNEFGRQTSSAAECRPCAAATFLGARECSSNGDTVDTEIDFLKEFFSSTHGENWNKTDGWMTTEDFCSWYGVSCNAAGQVVKISLEGNGLTGTPSSSLYQLPSLRSLELQNNEINFAFQGISAASSLATLDLSATNLNSIAGIVDAKSLVELHLTDNDLKGDFPPELLELVNLRQLFLNFNSIEGQIPAGISSLGNLEELYIFNNRLEGQIPASIGSLSNLRILALSENNIHGTIPLEMGDLSNLEVLAIQREGGKDSSTVGVDQGVSEDDGPGLTGSLPAFDKLKKLKQLFLGVNSLSGSIPYNFLSGIEDKSSEIEVDLISNRLTGGIPASLAQFDSLTLFVAGNRLIEPIPDGICRNGAWMTGEVGTYGCTAILCPPGTSSVYGRHADGTSSCQNCTSQTSTPYYGSFACRSDDQQEAIDERTILEELYRATDGDSWKYRDNWMDPDISICEWYGITCTTTEDRSVESIHLMKNGLIGEIPTSIYELPNLEEMNFASNDINVTFVGIGGASKLEYVNLDSTGLQSLTGLAQAPSLRLLHIVDNDFRGVFPSEIFSLGNLEVLDMSDNSFGASFPASIGSLVNLVYLSCSQCGFEGILSANIGSLRNLEYLNLAHNSFTEIPVEIETLTNLKYVDFSNQATPGPSGISGSLPSFANFTQLTVLSLQGNQFQGAIPQTFLQSVGSSEVVTVDLRSNRLEGAIPTSLSGLQQLNIYLADNLINDIPLDLCSLPWNSRPASASGCDHILCDAGSFNSLGRATADLPCEQCLDANEALYMGSTACGDVERDVLIQLYRELGGNEWVHSSGWTSQNHVCTWFGIECHEGGDLDKLVKTIDLGNNDLVGTVSSRIWLLTHMTDLNLRENDIDISFDRIGDAGSLQNLQLSQTRVKSLEGVGAANSLVSLHLTSNDIPGAIPDEIYDLTLLERLFLNFNQLTGTLSSRIGMMSNLQEFYLFNNALNGTLPDQPGLGDLESIRVLSLGENRFTGPIPDNLSFLPSVEVISLQKERQEKQEFAGIVETGFVGDLPRFHRTPKLRELYLGYNALGGTIPSSFLEGVEDKTVTMRVDLTHNRIHGVVPKSLAEFGDLRLFVADNLIHDIEPEICEMHGWMDGLLATGCDALLCPPGSFNDYGRRIGTEDCRPCNYYGLAQFYGTTFCGALLPETYTQKQILDEFFQAAGGANWKDSTNWETDAPICDRFGIECEQDGKGQKVVTKVLLPSNGLQNHMPSVIFYLPSLKALNVANNEIDISFKDIEDAATLEELYFDSTNVLSLEGLGQASNLKVLKMDNNAFYGGDIPDELFDLTELELLDVSNCGFAGSLSPMVGRLTRLQSFICASNDLTGTIPDEIGQMNALQTLDLSDNDLFGPLPSALENLESLQTLSLASRKKTSGGLSGPLLSFAAMPKLRNLDLGSNLLTGEVPGDLLLGVDNPGDTINVRLDSNILTGEVPSSLSRLTRLNIDLSDNEIESIGESLCEMKLWWDGNVDRFTCNGLLCPPGFFSEAGRQTSEADRCIECLGEERSPYWGSTYCPSQVKARMKEILESVYTATDGPNWKKRDGWMSDTIDICDWHGITCKSEVEIESIMLGSNNLVGTPPKEIFELPGLKLLSLHSNPIDFSFEGIKKAVSLTSLQLDSTGLSSLDGIGAAPALAHVNVRFNNLSGKMTSEIEQLTYLESFLCGDNGLTGALPSFSSNRQLETLRLERNEFSGPLPSFASHPNMKALDVSGNKLDGVIPGDLLNAADSSKPIFLDLSGNLFVGTIPQGLSRFDEVTLYARDNRIEGIHPDLCEEKKWNGGDVALFGCDAILCPANTWSPNGRASDDENGECQPCNKAAYFGYSDCGGSSATGAVVFSHIVAGLTAFAALWGML